MTWTYFAANTEKGFLVIPEVAVERIEEPHIVEVIHIKEFGALDGPGRDVSDREGVSGERDFSTSEGQGLCGAAPGTSTWLS
jgi:hypothetical protein